MRVRWLGWAGAEYEHDGRDGGGRPARRPGRDVRRLRRRGQRRRAAAGGRRRQRARSPAWSATCTATTPTPAPSPQRSRPAPRSTTREPWGDANLALAQAEHELGDGEAPAAAGRDLGVGRGRPVHLHGAPGGRRARRPAGLLARRGGRQRASCTSATPSFTAAGGRWRAGPDRSTSCSRPSTAPSSTSRTSSRRARCPAAMVPEQAALAGELLGAGTVIPMHYGGFAFEPHYVPIAGRPRAVRGRGRAGGPTAPPRWRRARRSNGSRRTRRAGRRARRRKPSRGT